MKLNHFQMKKTMSVILSVAMVASLGACSAKGSVSGSAGALGEASADALIQTKAIGNSAATYVSGDATKEETVYIFADAQGDTDHIVVSDWLKNVDGVQVLEDASDLEDIENVKGDEEYTTGEGDKITWQSNGNDIYYQGISGKDAPISVDISYKLEGKEILPNELVGKSGKVTIRYTFASNKTQLLETSSGQACVPIPFAAVTGMILPTEQFHNVTADHAQVISDGSRQIVIGLAVPGLEECLGIEELADTLGSAATTLKGISDYFEVTADVTDFSLSETVTLASADLSQVLSVEIPEDSELSDDLNTLEGSAQQLTEGTSQLLSGVTELSDGSMQLDSGMQSLIDGTATLKSGSYALVSGAMSAKTGSNELSVGATSLYDGTSTLALGSGTLEIGATQLAEGSSALSGGMDRLMNQAFSSVDENANLKSGSEALVNGASLLVAGYEGNGVTAGAVGGAQALSAGLSDLQTAVEETPASVSLTEEQLLTIGSAASAQASNSIGADQAATALAMMGITTDTEGYESYLAAMTGILQQTAADAASSGAQAGAQAVAEEASAQMGATTATLDANIGALKEGADTLSAGVSSLYAGTVSLQSGISQMDTAIGSLEAGMGALQGGAATVSTGASDLASGVSSLNTGASDLNSGAKSLSEGASTLNEGLSALYEGADTLDQGVGTLQDGETVLGDGTTSLVEGVTTLLTGSQALDEGMQLFQSEGIDRLVSMGDALSVFTDRCREMTSEKNGYTNFSGIAPEGIGTVRFVIRAESIK